MDSLELEARPEKLRDHLDHTLDILHSEEDKRREGDPLESVVD